MTGWPSRCAMIPPANAVSTASTRSMTSCRSPTLGPVLLLGPPFERLVHLLEAAPRRRLRRRRQEDRHQQPAEALALREAHPVYSQGRDHEMVLAVKDAGQSHPPDPAQFTLGIGLKHARAERERAPAGGPDMHFNLLPDCRRAARAVDEGVPVREAREIGDNLPHAL